MFRSFDHQLNTHNTVSKNIFVPNSLIIRIQNSSITIDFDKKLI